jgi:hypothetical protein
MLSDGFDSKGENMTEQNRGIMKFKEADSMPAVAISGVLIIGSIALLIQWALQSAYVWG